MRSISLVPMLRKNDLIGAITVYQQTVRPFTDRQIALLAGFANQAVIAIENARLLTELRARSEELSRSVGELRMLAEVSQAVNKTLDLETVLSTIAAKAVQLAKHRRRCYLRLRRRSTSFSAACHLRHGARTD